VSLLSCLSLSVIISPVYKSCFLTLTLINITLRTYSLIVSSTGWIDTSPKRHSETPSNNSNLEINIRSIDLTPENYPKTCTWSANFEDTMVYIEHVIAYLKDGLIKFQSYLEGEKIIGNHLCSLPWPQDHPLSRKDPFKCWPYLKVAKKNPSRRWSSHRPNNQCGTANLCSQIIKDDHEIRNFPNIPIPKDKRVKFIFTCDICQKSKTRRHAPYGLLQPIPIPDRPFEVVTMDFIPELPESKGHDNILVIADKLTKFATFLPCLTNNNEEEIGNAFFKNIITKYSLPRQIISDRDPKWTGATAYHPQADGQTEIMNQVLGVALRSYIGPERDNWSEFLRSCSMVINLIHTSDFSALKLLRSIESKLWNQNYLQPTKIEAPRQTN